MTVNVFEPVFPFASVALTVTVVVPIGNVEPDGGAAVGVMAPSTVSVASASVNVTGAPEGPVASAVMFAGTVTTGAVVS